jgi:multidrug efflux pump subunit AcrA (membrane-fusion protein)
MKEAEGSMKLRVLLNIGLAVAALAGGVLLAWWMILQRPKPAERQPRKVVPKVVAPPIRPLLDRSVRIVGYGSARPRIQLEITPQVSGVVVTRAPNFRSGKYVRAGQVLIEIEKTDYVFSAQRVERRIKLLEAQLAQLNQEEANLKASRKIEGDRVKLAEDQLEKARRLYKDSVGSEDDVDKAREALLARQGQLRSVLNQLELVEPRRRQIHAELGTARVELQQAETDLARCVVKSPVTGRVLSSRIEVGEYVKAGNNCGELYGVTFMEVPVSVPAADLVWIDEELLEICKLRRRPPDAAHRITATVQWERPGSGETITWRGCVERVEAGLEAQTRTAVLVVQVKNPSLRNGPGENPAADPADPDGKAPDAKDPVSGGSGARANEAMGNGPKERQARKGRTGVPCKRSPNENKPVLEMNMFCRVTVLGKRLAKAYILPRRAILPDGSVYVVVDGRLRKRPVRVARTANEEAMILPGGGVEDGDRVVIGYIPKPVVGMAVDAIDRMPGSGDETPGPSGESSKPSPDAPGPGKEK